MTGSRGAVIGIAVGVAAMTVSGIGHRRGRLLVAAVGLLMAAAALLTPGIAGPILQRFSTAAADSGSGRLDIWAVGATIFGQHPLLGVGYAAFPAAFTPEMVRLSAVPGLAYDSPLSTRGPHSILVGTAAELGIIGIVCLGLFLWRVLSARSSLGLWSFVRAALVATLAQAMLLDILGRKQLWLLLGIALGIAAAARNPDAGAVAASVPPHTSPTSTDSAGEHAERPAAHGV